MYLKIGISFSDLSLDHRLAGRGRVKYLAGQGIQDSADPKRVSPLIFYRWGGRRGGGHVDGEDVQGGGAEEQGSEKRSCT